MPGHLERHRPALPGSPADPGPATSLTDLSFDRQALIYADDMPRAFRPGVRSSTELALRSHDQARPAGELILATDAPRLVVPRPEADTRRIEKEVIASGMRQLDKPRKAGERVVQRRIGWQATPSLIVITTAERELEKTASGKYAPAGGWLIEDRRTYPETEGKAAKRTGTVPEDPAEGTAGGPRAHTTETKLSATFPEGACALGLLPAQVRSSAIARVPSPIQFDGVVLREMDRQETPQRIEVNVLRMDTRRAVVIQASRGISDSRWSVSQATYRLGEAVIEQA